eukprot:TRINITY_DN2912_c0_g1_i1.p1 TRINITY_DN2912_c0_g1~~TRINITY_DN2912_c0_g1_i1.p1  ORF type:complete len:634 (-),score=157.98 TRINITY_DN2912_c0_g1_i1:79-1980(-)
MEDLLALKQLHDHGFLSTIEYNKRRLEIVDKLTNTGAARGGGGGGMAAGSGATLRPGAGGAAGTIGGNQGTIGGNQATLGRQQFGTGGVGTQSQQQFGTMNAGSGQFGTIDRMAGGAGMGQSLSQSGSVSRQQTQIGNQMPAEFAGNTMNAMQQRGGHSGVLEGTGQMQVQGGAATMMAGGAIPISQQTGGAISLHSPNMMAPPPPDIGQAKVFSWEFFHAAANNNVKRMSELLAAGVDVDQRDPDSDNTALHVAATKGQKHALYYLVDQGSDIDAQNKRGQTGLHCLVNNRYTTLAIWLVKHGADINIEDQRGFTPYDMALPWLQKEMKEAVYGRKRTVQARGQKQQGINYESNAEGRYQSNQMMNPNSLAAQQQVGMGGMTMMGGNPYGTAAPAQNPFATMNANTLASMGTMGGGGMGTMGGGMGTMGAGGMGTMTPGMMGGGTMGGGGMGMGMGDGMGTLGPQATLTSSARQTMPPGSMGTLGPQATLASSGAHTLPMGGGAANGGASITAKKTSGKNVKQEVMKVYLKNAAYKSLVITSETKAGDVCNMIAEKLGMEEYAYTLDLIDSQKGTERRMDPTANVYRAKENWPLILGKSGNETEQHCKFVVVPKRGTTEKVQMMYRKAMYGK